MKDRYLNTLKNIVLSQVKNEDTSVFLFGSRAKSERPSRSDVDIGFISSEKIDSTFFAGIRDKAEDSIVPYRIDLVDFSSVDRDFKETAMKRIVIIKSYL